MMMHNIYVPKNGKTKKYTIKKFHRKLRGWIPDPLILPFVSLDTLSKISHCSKRQLFGEQADYIFGSLNTSLSENPQFEDGR